MDNGVKDIFEENDKFVSNNSNTENSNLNSEKIEDDIPIVQDANSVGTGESNLLKVDSSAKDIEVLDTDDVSSSQVVDIPADVLEEVASSEEASQEIVVEETENAGEKTQDVTLEEASVASASTVVSSQEIAIPDDANASSENNNVFSIYQCNNCKTIIGKYGEKPSKCISCSGEEFAIVSKDLIEKPQIIPFNKELEHAIKDYKRKVSSIFLPLKFKSKSVVSSISKAYVPVSLHKMNVVGDVTYYAGDKSVADKDKANYNKFEVDYTTNFDYDNIPSCEFLSIDLNKFLLFGNYDYSQAVSYDSGIVGDSIIVMDENNPLDDLNKAKDLVVENSLNVVKNTIKHQVKKIKTNGLIVNDLSCMKVLVPIYYLCVKYKDMDYVYIMNGQNGNSIIDIPISKKNIIIFSILLFILIFAISFVLCYFF